MPVTQTSIVAAKDINGNAVRIKQESSRAVIEAETVDGKKVYLETDTQPYDIEQTTKVEFDDLVDPKRTLEWGTDVPDAAWRIVNVGFFDNSKLVFSDPREAAKFLDGLPKILSPREKRGRQKVVEFKSPENGQEAK